MKGGDGEKVMLQIVQAEILTPVACLESKGDDHYTIRTLLRIILLFWFSIENHLTFTASIWELQHKKLTCYYKALELPLLYLDLHGSFAHHLIHSTLVLYMSSNFWLLAPESPDLSQAEKVITACKAA